MQIWPLSFHTSPLFYFCLSLSKGCDAMPHPPLTTSLESTIKQCNKGWAWQCPWKRWLHEAWMSLHECSSPPFREDRESYPAFPLFPIVSVIAKINLTRAFRPFFPPNFPRLHIPLFLPFKRRQLYIIKIHDMGYISHLSRPFLNPILLALFKTPHPWEWVEEVSPTGGLKISPNMINLLGTEKMVPRGRE